MRKYQPIWIKIKKDKRASVSVPASAADRVKKAVIKEKDQDLGFKIQNEDEPRRLVITYEEDKSIMRFVLVDELCNF